MSSERWVPAWLEPVWSRLAQADAAGRLPHAILLAGPEGWGKRFLARQFARRLAGLAPSDPRIMAFGDEASDGDLLAHPDVRLVHRQPADSGRLRRQILIDQVRELGEFLVRTAGAGAHRVAVIELAEELNVSAANALLKRLEEPGPGCHLLLVAHRPGQVLATIRSRCQQLAVAPGSPADARAWLASRLPEGVDAGRLLQLVGGAPLLARERAESDVMRLADAVEAYLASGAAAGATSAAADALIGDDRERGEMILELLYRALAREVRATPGREAAAGLRFLDRVTRARKMLQSQSNPNVTLLLEDLLLGTRTG